MSAPETMKNLSLLLMIIGKGEQTIENRRQLLWTKPDFDSYVIFKLLDRESKSFIDRDDIIFFLENIGIKISKEEAEFLIFFYDSNKDKVLDYSEFCTFLEGKSSYRIRCKNFYHCRNCCPIDIRPQNEAILRSLFEKEIFLIRGITDLLFELRKKADYDSSEIYQTLRRNCYSDNVDKNCIRRFLDINNERFTELDLDSIMTRLDINSNGKIDFNEFKDFLDFPLRNYFLPSTKDKAQYFPKKDWNKLLEKGEYYPLQKVKLEELEKEIKDKTYENEKISKALKEQKFENEILKKQVENLILEKSKSYLNPCCPSLSPCCREFSPLPMNCPYSMRMSMSYGTQYPMRMQMPLGITQMQQIPGYQQMPGMTQGPMISPFQISNEIFSGKANGNPLDFIKYRGGMIPPTMTIQGIPAMTGSGVNTPYGGFYPNFPINTNIKDKHKKKKRKDKGHKKYKKHKKHHSSDSSDEEESNDDEERNEENEEKEDDEENEEEEDEIDEEKEVDDEEKIK